MSYRLWGLIKNRGCTHGSSGGGPAVSVYCKYEQKSTSINNNVCCSISRVRVVFVFRYAHTWKLPSTAKYSTAVNIRKCYYYTDSSQISDRSSPAAAAAGCCWLLASLVQMQWHLLRTYYRYILDKSMVKGCNGVATHR